MDFHTGWRAAEKQCTAYAERDFFQTNGGKSKLAAYFRWAFAYAIRTGCFCPSGKQELDTKFLVVRGLGLAKRQL